MKNSSSTIYDSHLFLRQGTTYTKIPLSDIKFIQADGNYAYLQTVDKRFVIKRSLAAIMDDLDPRIFARISRGILVNFSKVDRVSFADGTVELDGDKLKLGKAYHSDVKSRMPRL